MPTRRTAPRILAATLALAAMCLAHGAQAQTGTPADSTPAGWAPLLSVGPVVSTLGLGAEIGARFDDRFGLRLNANGFSFSANHTVRDVRYDGDATLESFGLLADLHPFGDGWRVTAGARLNLNEVDLKGTPRNATYTIHGMTYTANEVGSLNGKIAFNRFAPYIGVGYEGAVADRWRFGVDLGAMYHGTPRVSLDASGPVTTTPDFQNRLDAERQELRDDVKDYSWYPVLSLTVKYAF
ncbi:hypothetical protein UAJ10_26915 [Nitrospirillum sp. BR 11164]|uniref:hypothetical protein n=1 Tax=Nitrospirillum sp. BR 11164 TaxID=3104324 RepID=UPI002AFEEB3E|nr:hypothetical protein [Nitrospirillum sp. BR 11164]MEA1652630.1 hypothetical protein [Nitrospirillum sp. BR 11164]